MSPTARPGTAAVRESVTDSAGSCSFRPEYRLRKTDEFSSVFALRRTQRSRHFVLHHGPSGCDGARLGVVVAKRFVKRAHARNLLKRIMREAFRHIRPELKPLDIVLRLNARPDPLDRRLLRAEIDALFARVRRQDTKPITTEAVS
ncbi:MAG: ribonuclease P protein component [Gammaproteobacteria bacterium]|nr:ribonuclease P protein component [Gammaproteobacteria bacterium]MBU0772327.1 ribonuclease P protein component [Gammaproteobacteria bacterium]MBU0857938.1 ribonuclease P protein component [Gammaproteobacteria bacterium]